MPIDAAFAHFPVLTTERLILRQVQPEDADALFVIKSDLKVTSHYAQEPHQSLADTQGWIQRLQTAYDQRQALFWCLRLKGEDTAIGSCTFWNFGPGFHTAELGYELNRNYWQKGYMSEALLAALRHGFTELDLNRVEAIPLARNAASNKLLDKLGFTLEGTLRQREYYQGQFEDQLHYGMLKEDWLKLTPSQE